MLRGQRPDRSIGRLRVSPRQREILELLALGHTDKEIARALDISERTVETYLSQLYEKTGIHRRAGLVAFWLRQEGRWLKLEWARAGMTE
jgi:DNA-binding CsgD family transcriptional regulator